jgi:hypothetical protein
MVVQAIGMDPFEPTVEPTAPDPARKSAQLNREANKVRRDTNDPQV